MNFLYWSLRYLFTIVNMYQSSYCAILTFTLQYAKNTPVHNTVTWLDYDAAQKACHARFCCFCLSPIILLHPARDAWAAPPIHLPPLLFVLLCVSVTCKGISCEDISGWGQRRHCASIKSVASESVRTSLAVTLGPGALRAEGDGRFVLSAEDAVGRVWLAAEPPHLAVPTAAICHSAPITKMEISNPTWLSYLQPSADFFIYLSLVVFHSQSSQQMVKVTTVWYPADKLHSKIVNTLSRTWWFKLG